MKNWTEQLQPIIDEYKDGDDTPLDWDSVDELAYIIKAKINLQEGNLTPEEYEERLNLGAVEVSAIQYASHYLCDEDMIEALNLIKVQAEIDDDMPLDDVEGIVVWEQVTGKYTVGEFLEMIY